MKRIVLSGFMFSLLLLVGFALGNMQTTAVAASKDDVCAALNSGSTTAAGPGTCDGVHSGVTVEGIVKTAINIISWVVGIISVIMVIVGGFQYVTSGGDSNKVVTAKNTIMYALIGAVIAALAQVMVNFVLHKAK